jgi:asparagine synthase (glutamine-hydrolysing)
MCGIAGIYYSANDRPVERSLLQSMTDVIQHRGPDAEGFYLDANVGLGHRRLSIIDLESGDQPMIDPDTQNVIVYNGEIYNYLELRLELQRAGHHFRTQSDTEVLLKAYAEWGTSCLSRLNGMWSFALWDHQRRLLFVARDRLGIKPLHYFHDGQKFLFGSEIKCILAAGVEKELNFELLDLYLTLGYIPAPYSFYKNIRKLEPGHHLVVRGENAAISQYWNIPRTMYTRSSRAFSMMRSRSE